MIADLFDNFFNRIEKLFGSKPDEEERKEPPLPALALLRQAISEATANFIIENSVLFDDDQAYNCFALKKITLIVKPENQMFVQQIKRLPAEVSRNFAMTAIKSTAQNQHIDTKEFFGLGLARLEDTQLNPQQDPNESEQMIHVLAYDQQCQLNDLTFIFNGTFRAATPPAKAEGRGQTIHLGGQANPANETGSNITKLTPAPKPQQPNFGSQQTKLNITPKTSANGWLIIRNDQDHETRIAIDTLPYTLGRGLRNDAGETAAGHDLGQRDCVSRRHLCITGRDSNGDLNVINFAHAGNGTWRKNATSPMPERFLWQNNAELILGGQNLNEDTILIQYQAD